MSKKEDERPRFRCPKCYAVWVYHEPICIVCGVLGVALNMKAERILRKWERSEENEQENTDLTLLSKDKNEPTQMLIDEWNRRF